jgi:hypothetical protein
MPLTNQQLFDFQVIIARRVVVMDELLCETINLQHQMGKALAVTLPGLTPEQRRHMQDTHMGAETNLEHLEAATQAFRKSFEEFVKINT